MKKIHSFDEVFDSQQMFRLILKAMSNPLKIVEIKKYADKLFGESKELLAIALTLLDNEVTFFSFENKELDENIVSLTLSEKSDCENADFIFTDSPENLFYAISNAKCGTLSDPHKSATIIAKINTGCDTSITMSGPGIDGRITLVTENMVFEAISQRDKMCFEFPQGIDLIFIDDESRLFSIPRLIKREG